MKKPWRKNLEKALEELERLALSEAKNNCGLLTTKAGRSRYTGAV